MRQRYRGVCDELIACVFLVLCGTSSNVSSLAYMSGMTSAYTIHVHIRRITCMEVPT